MQCPNCRQVTIHFLAWCRSPNAFLWRCPHCDVALKAGKATWGWFISVIPFALLVVAIVIYLENQNMIEKEDSRSLIFFGIFSLLPLIYLAFRFGSYTVRHTTRDNERR